MKVEGDYSAAGYALVTELMRPELAKAMLDSIWAAVRDAKFPVVFAKHKILTKSAMELHSSNYAPLTTFLWGLTPIASSLTGCALLPTYCFFRLYQKGDRLRVHTDRDACEHSLTLTLGYSDGQPWAFNIEPQQLGSTSQRDTPDEALLSSIPMMPGDAVLYRGPMRRHGRVTPNPNSWSAHLFMHWVDAAGPHRKLAFEDFNGAAD